MYSDVRAIALGDVPPSPKPVRSRRTSIDLIELVLAVSSEQKPNQTVQNSRIVRRPNRSARGPKNNALQSIPIRPAVRIGPIAPREMFHSAERVGATLSSIRYQDLRSKASCSPRKAQRDHDRANLRRGWMSPLSAALIASRYPVRASLSLTRFAEPQENVGRLSLMASTSAIRRACLPFPLGNG